MPSSDKAMLGETWQRMLGAKTDTLIHHFTLIPFVAGIHPRGGKYKTVRSLFSVSLAMVPNEYMAIVGCGQGSLPIGRTFATHRPYMRMQSFSGRVRTMATTS